MKEFPAFSRWGARSRMNSKELGRLKGRFVSEDQIDMMITGPTEVYAGDKLMAKYLPGALREFATDEIRDVLVAASQGSTDNRGLASGYERKHTKGKSTRTRTPKVRSTILGSFDRSPAHQMRCRLTAWSGREVDKWQALFPLFQAVDGYFKGHVPDRYANQEGFAKRTHDDWRIAGTVFTTVTVNRSYPTGVHTDAGDLDEGFSTLAVLRRGAYSGGIFTFPEFRLGVDMQHGDLLLMDAHQWHGNTPMFCGECGDQMGSTDLYPDHEDCGSERISMVSYYRTKMAQCGSAEEEARRGIEFADRNIERRHEKLLQEMEAETAIAPKG